jgi:hypothetical protein
VGELCCMAGKLPGNDPQAAQHHAVVGHLRQNGR